MKKFIFKLNEETIDECINDSLEKFEPNKNEQIKIKVKKQDLH